MTSSTYTPPDKPVHPGWLTLKNERIALAFVLMLVGLLYLPGINGPLLHDDLARLNSETVQATKLDLPSLLASTKEYPQRPLAMMTFAANHAMCGPDPVCYKSTNVILHLTTGLALWLLLKQLCSAGNRRHLFAAPDWLPLAVTTVWLLHPLHVSTVLYAVQRMTQLATLFSLLAMAAWLKGREEEEGSRKALGWLLVAVLALLVGALCKESAWLTLPLIALIELLLLTPAWRQRIPHKAVLGWSLAAAVLAILWLLAHYPPRFILNSYISRDFTPPERLLTEARILFYYASEILWPDPRRMSIFLDNFQVSRTFFSPMTTPIAVLAYAAIIGFSLTALLKKPSLVAFGLLFFLVGHVLESSLIGLILAYEHRNYLPGIGLLLAGIALLTALPVKLQALKMVAISLSACVLAFTLSIRVTAWSTEDNLVAAMSAPRWADSHAANLSIARHANRQYQKHQDDPMLARLYRGLANKHFLLSAQATTQPFLPLVSLVARQTSREDTELYWKMLEEAARDAPLNKDALNATTWLAVCLLSPDCPVSRQHFARYLNLILENPRQSATTRWQFQRVAGTFFTRSYGDIETGLMWARRAAASGHPEARESLIKNLAYAGHTEEAQAEYQRLRSEVLLIPEQVARIEAAIANPGVALP